MRSYYDGEIKKKDILLFFLIYFVCTDNALYWHWNILLLEVARMNRHTQLFELKTANCNHVIYHDLTRKCWVYNSKDDSSLLYDEQEKD